MIFPLRVKNIQLPSFLSWSISMAANNYALAFVKEFSQDERVKHVLPWMMEDAPGVFANLAKDDPSLTKPFGDGNDVPSAYMTASHDIMSFLKERGYMIVRDPNAPESIDCASL